jgi:hypothetical protein
MEKIRRMTWITSPINRELEPSAAFSGFAGFLLRSTDQTRLENGINIAFDFLTVIRWNNIRWGAGIQSPWINGISLFNSIPVIAFYDLKEP